jgi:undecaprenyl-diphosphatase
LEIFQAIVLAVVQGITEFLPVSSSAHLILTPIIFGWQDQGLAFDVAVHVGTLFAVVYYLRKQLISMASAWFGGWQSRQWNQDGKLAWLLLAATIPVGLVGCLANHWIEANLRSAMIIAGSTLIFGILLGLSDRGAQSNSKSLSQLNIKSALLVGCAQVFALVPGASRSGVTMTALLFAGFTRQAAATFSFMLAIPVIASSGLLKGYEMTQSQTIVDWPLLLLGALVSAVIAFLSIQWFMDLVQRIGMMPFVIYRVLLALVIILLVY